MSSILIFLFCFCFCFPFNSIRIRRLVHLIFLPYWQLLFVIHSTIYSQCHVSFFEHTLLRTNLYLFFYRFVCCRSLSMKFISHTVQQPQMKLQKKKQKPPCASNNFLFKFVCQTHIYARPIEIVL